MKKNVLLMSFILFGLLIVMVGCSNPEEEARVIFNEAQVALNDDSQDGMKKAEALLDELSQKYPQTVISTEAVIQLDVIRKIDKAIAMINEGDVHEAVVLLKPVTQASKHPILQSTAEYVLTEAVQQNQQGVTRATRSNDNAKRDGRYAFTSLIAYWAEKQHYPQNLGELKASEIRLSEGVYLSYQSISNGQGCLITVHHENGDAGYFATSNNYEDGFTEVTISDLRFELENNFKVVEKEENLQVIELAAK